MTLKGFLFPKLNESRLSLVLLILRLVAGCAMMLHGWGKVQNPMAWQGPDSTTPALFQLLAVVAEFGGGLAWIVGLLTPLASFGIAATMSVAAYTHAVIFNDPFVGKGSSYELASLYWCIAVLFLVVGPGKFSIDQIIRNRLRR